MRHGSIVVYLLVVPIGIYSLAILYIQLSNAPLLHSIGSVQLQNISSIGQLPKALYLISFIDGGRFKVIKPHPENEPLSNFCRLSGKSTFIRDLQQQYLQPIVTQYLVCNKSEIWP